MHYLIAAGLMLAIYLFAMPAKAATVWTPQEGIYQKLKSAKGATMYIKLVGVKAVTADAVIVQAGEKVVPVDAEIVQAGYKQVPIDTVITGNVIPPECEGKFYCDAQWGILLDLSKNTSLQCPKVFVKRNDALAFDAAIQVDNTATCAK